jgi:hypothetical protein
VCGLGGHPVCGGVLESRGAAGPGSLVRYAVVRASSAPSGSFEVQLRPPRGPRPPSRDAAPQRFSGAPPAHHPPSGKQGFANVPLPGRLLDDGRTQNELQERGLRVIGSHHHALLEGTRSPRRLEPDAQRSRPTRLQGLVLDDRPGAAAGSGDPADDERLVAEVAEAELLPQCPPGEDPAEIEAPWLDADTGPSGLLGPDRRCGEEERGRDEKPERSATEVV